MSDQTGYDTELLPLLGTDEATIDNRGRILLGKKKRERLGDSFAITIGEFGCICAYPAVSWRARIREINSYPPNNIGRQKYSRFLLGDSDDDLTCDPQGRVVIPRKLQEMGKLKDKVLLVGCGDRLEIWDPVEYESYLSNPDDYCRDRRIAMENAYNEMKR